MRQELRTPLILDVSREGLAPFTTCATAIAAWHRRMMSIALSFVTYADDGSIARERRSIGLVVRTCTEEEFGFH